MTYIYRYILCYIIYVKPSKPRGADPSPQRRGQQSSILLQWSELPIDADPVAHGKSHVGHFGQEPLGLGNGRVIWVWINTIQYI